MTITPEELDLLETLAGNANCTDNVWITHMFSHPDLKIFASKMKDNAPSARSIHEVGLEAN